MTEDRARKVAKVVGALIRQPRYAPRYVRQGLRDTRSATDMELPWFSFGAIDVLAQRLTGKETVYEFGGGGSTLFLARRAAHVVTVENSDEWYDSLTEALAARELTNVDLRRADADFTDAATFADSAFANALPTARADIVLIDSYDFDPPHALRPLLFTKAEAMVKPGGMIVIDDSWRYTALRTNNHARSVLVKAGLGPARKSVTSTDFYLY